MSRLAQAKTDKIPLDSMKIELLAVEECQFLRPFSYHIKNQRFCLNANSRFEMIQTPGVYGKQNGDG